MFLKALRSYLTNFSKFRHTAHFTTKHNWWGRSPHRREEVPTAAMFFSLKMVKQVCFFCWKQIFLESFKGTTGTLQTWMFFGIHLQVSGRYFCLGIGLIRTQIDPKTRWQGDLVRREVAQLQSWKFPNLLRCLDGKFWDAFWRHPETGKTYYWNKELQWTKTRAFFWYHLKSCFACVWCRRPMRACGHFQSPKMKARYDLLIHFDHGGLFDVVSFLLIIWKFRVLSEVHRFKESPKVLISFSFSAAGSPQNQPQQPSTPGTMGSLRQRHGWSQFQPAVFDHVIDHLDHGSVTTLAEDAMAGCRCWVPW